MIHIVFGFILLIAFLLSGYFMQELNQEVILDSSVRMQYRSVHIYILFSALLHIVLGNFITFSRFALFKQLQKFGLWLLILSSICFLMSFISEIPSIALERIYTRFGVYSSLAAILLITIPNLWKKRKRR